MADDRALDVVAGNLLKHRAGGERHRTADVRQTAMGRSKGERAVAEISEHAEHPDVHPVFEILLPEVFGDGAAFLHGSEGELLPRSAGELALRGERSDPAQDGLLRDLQLNEDELAVHGQVLEVAAIGEREVGVELHPAFLKASEHADDLVLGK
jgi:hypothetical protein